MKKGPLRGLFVGLLIQRILVLSRKAGGRLGSGDVPKRSASEPETRRPFVLRLNTRIV